MQQPEVRCRATDVPPGTVRALDANGLAIAVANVEGSWYAFDDTCTHQGCSLSEGELDGMTIICPCHLGEFDITSGEVMSGPPPAPVRTYPVCIVGEEIHVVLTSA
ncbi:MAG: non-heme iron oxygenase ferredoxin subunit [Chloroflexi bacterium]|nr:non-heme iron oxygenase ferredoxin subunit [Chloroflexota bacterium]